MDDRNNRKRQRQLSAAEEPEDAELVGLLPAPEDEEEGSSSEMTQSTRTTTLSTWGTSKWNRFETTQHRPRALTSPILLKTSKSSESGNGSKWSTGSSGSGQEKILVLRSAFSEPMCGDQSPAFNGSERRVFYTSEDLGFASPAMI